MKIVKLDIDENSVLSGIDAVALVEQPAIEEEFMYFSQESFAETFNDYPQAAVDAAKQGIKRNEATGNKCATRVGKVRAQQLANREAISLDTVRRMRSFLIRQRDNYELQRDRKNYDACGYISYLLWGGPSALSWAEKTLRQAGEEFVKEEYNDLDDACQPGYKAIGLKTKNGRKVPNCVPIQNFEAVITEELIKQEMFKSAGKLNGIEVYTTKEEAIEAAKEAGISGYHEHEKDGEIVYMPGSSHSEATDALLQESFSATDEEQVLVGPLMTPNKLIKRRDADGEYYVYFTEDTIKKLAYKAMKDKIIDRVNLEHNSTDKVDAYLVESWLVEDETKDKSTNYGFSPKKGQWYGKYKVDDKKIWDDYIKSGLVKGFSVEGMFESIMFSKTKCRKNGQCGCGKTQHAGGMCDGSHLNK